MDMEIAPPVMEMEIAPPVMELEIAHPVMEMEIACPVMGGIASPMAMVESIASPAMEEVAPPAMDILNAFPADKVKIASLAKTELRLLLELPLRVHCLSCIVLYHQCLLNHVAA